MKRYLLSIFAISILVFSTCQRPQTQSSANSEVETKETIEVPLPPIELVNITDTVMDEFIQQNKKYTPFIKASKEFYRKRNNEYAWFTKEGISPRMDMLVNLINGSEFPEKISSDSLHNVYYKIREDSSIRRAQVGLLNMEMSLTYTFFNFADKEWSGNDEKLVRKLEWYIPKKKLKYADVLDSLLKKDDTSFHAPVYNQYEKLRTFLHKYREIEEKGGWPYIQIVKKGFKIGDTSQIVRLIKKRLYISGDLAAFDSVAFFDKTLESAVKIFQKRYGMIEDGIVGPQVIREMNVPIHKRVEQIIINMERCRWVPTTELNGEYFMVNIPEFKLYAYDKSNLAWTMNVVVGKATNKTVIFNGNLKYVVFNPYWSVPHHLFSKEILPHLRKSPSWLKSHDMEVIKNGDSQHPIDPYAVNWKVNSNNLKSYTVRQKPGKTNALGNVKFLFPNEYNIYLHDTPEKDLFALPTRSFSHGCIRLAEPTKMAQYLLRKEQGWNAKTISEAMATGKEQYYSLKKSVPVFIAYFTAWVDNDGRINFRGDLYGHDAKMAKVIIEKPRI